MDVVAFAAHMQVVEALPVHGGSEVDCSVPDSVARHWHECCRPVREMQQLQKTGKNRHIGSMCCTKSNPTVFGRQKQTPLDVVPSEQQLLALCSRKQNKHLHKSQRPLLILPLRDHLFVLTGVISGQSSAKPPFRTSNSNISMQPCLEPD